MTCSLLATAHDINHARAEHLLARHSSNSVSGSMRHYWKALLAYRKHPSSWLAGGLGRANFGGELDRERVRLGPIRIEIERIEHFLCSIAELSLS